MWDVLRASTPAVAQFFFGAAQLDPPAHNNRLTSCQAQMAAVALGVVGAGAAVVAGVRPSGMAALCLCAWGLAEAGAALWERLRQEAAPGAALWGTSRPASHGLQNNRPNLVWRPHQLPLA